MTELTRVAMAIVGLAMVTTLILPDRKTEQVVRAGGQVVQSNLYTAMTGKK